MRVSLTSSNNSSDKIQAFRDSKHFGASTDFTKLKEADAILSACPRPSNERREPDLSYVEQTAISIYPNLQPGRAVRPRINNVSGTTEELVLPMLGKEWLCAVPIASGPEMKIWLRFLLAFSPEREDPGNKQFGLAQIPKVVGGLNPERRARRHSTRRWFPGLCQSARRRAAEMAKLLENIFRCVNIALVKRTQAAQLAHEH